MRTPRNDTFIYQDETGQARAAEAVAVANPDGGAVGSIAGVDVIHINGVTVSGAAEILALDPDRIALTVRNASDTQMRIRVDGGEAAATDYPLDAGRGYEFPPNMIPKGAVSIFCATAGKAWNAMYASRDDA